MIKLSKKSQVSLEMALTFFVFGLFILGLITVSVWLNVQVVGRQNAYENTRISAATTGAGLTYPVYTPGSLTESDVIFAE